MSCFIVVISIVFVAHVNGASWKSRSMIYPSALSPIQFIGGFGIPVEDLAFETVVSGYALRMQYFLPSNASEITSIYLKPQPITDRGHRNDFNLGFLYRWILYRGIEMILENLKLPGHSCLLRLICEHATQPFSHESGLLGELLHIVLTPSSSRDYEGEPRNRDYLSAERFGKRGENCESSFGIKCKKSTLDLISVIL